MPDRRAILHQWTTQFHYQHGRAERAVGHFFTQIDVGSAQAAWAAAPKIELRRTILFVFEIARAVIVSGGVDSWTEIHRWLPVEIVMRVLALGDPDVYPAETAGTLTLKKHQMLVT